MGLPADGRECVLQRGQGLVTGRQHELLRGIAPFDGLPPSASRHLQGRAVRGSGFDLEWPCVAYRSWLMVASEAANRGAGRDGSGSATV